jgi:hypothetical protein
MPLLRPELVALSGLLLAESWLQTLLVHKVRATVEHVLRDGVFFFGTLAPWLIFSFVESGHLLPSTMSAKRDFFCDPCFPYPLRSAWFESGLTAFFTTVGLTGLGFFFPPHHAQGHRMPALRCGVSGRILARISQRDESL